MFEKKHGVKLGFMGFFTKACVQALKDIRAVNAEIARRLTPYHYPPRPTDPDLSPGQLEQACQISQADAWLRPRHLSSR